MIRDYGLLTLGRLAGRPEEDPPAPRRSRRGGRRPRPSPRGMGAVMDQTLALFRRLRLVAEELHGGGPLSGGKRNLLRELERLGPRTVPQMARARSVTRQHVQMHVNDLAGQGYVELVDNPAHKRSKLVRLTEEGEGAVALMRRREVRLLSQLDVAATEEELRNAANVLRAVRGAFESEGWRELVEREQATHAGKTERWD